MRIQLYGIVLKRLEKRDLELLRQWRNDPKISRHMFQQGKITPAMQQQWFRTVHNPQNFFFLILHGKKPVGLINLSSVDYEQRTAFSGLFIYEDAWLGTDVPVRASLCLLDVFFHLFGIETVYAKVRSSNPVAHRYNSALGFVRSKKIEMGLGYEYLLKKKDYHKATASLRSLAAKLYGTETLLHFNRTKVDAAIRALLPSDKEQLAVVHTQLI